MTNCVEGQYTSDADGKEIGVILPIKLWHEINSERETAHLLKSENMKRRLLEAKGGENVIPSDKVFYLLGL